MEWLFGAIAILIVIMIVGGTVLLRWQRNRYRFELMKAAMAQGMTRFPSDVPYWLASLREALMVLTVGVGLMLVGGAAIRLHVAPGPNGPNRVNTTRPAEEMRPVEQRPRPEEFRRDERMRPGDERPPFDPEGPRIQRQEAIQSLGMVAMACGAILTLLGIVRTIFAGVEKRYTAGPPDGPAAGKR